MSRIAVTFFFFVVALLSSKATSAAEPEPAFEEITVYLNMPGLGGTDLDVVIKDKEAYLSITGLFDYLKIKNQLSTSQDSISGFFLSQKDDYLIDKKNNLIKIRKKVFTLAPDELIQTPTGLYLKSGIFGKVFSLDCDFNFRTLSINLTSKLDLPVLHEKRQEMMRQNISKLRSEIIADTTIKKTYKLFNIGTADWSVSSTQTGSQNATNANLRLGAVIAGGETTLGLNYQNTGNFNFGQQNYLWHYVDNDNTFLRQVSAGKIGTASTASILGPVIGLQLSNASTVFRKSMGTYTLSDITNPDWVVELYLNNVLVDYVKADASGFYTFKVPMVYGASAIQLRFLGPWGEEQTREQTISIPYSFLPKNEMEYTISNGIVQDGKQSIFSREEIKYGLSHRITIGSGLEYLSSVSSNPLMPFVNASYRASSTLLLSGDYAYQVRTRAVATYRLPTNLQLELDYTKYKEGQQAILNNSLEEQKISISRQFRKQGFGLYTRISIDQVRYANARQTVADLLLSSTWQGISSNLTTYALLVNSAEPTVYSTLALSLKLPLKTTFRPQAQYTYSNNAISSYRAEVEKQFMGNGFLNIAFDNNLQYKTQGLTLGLRFDLSFARASATATRTNNKTSLTQSYNGGAIYDKKANFFKLNNNPNVGKAGLIIYPYLDLNGNNRRDANEPKVAGLQMKINGGQLESNLKDTTSRVLYLEPFTSYLLELNPASFDNIAWQLKNTSYKIVTDPNQLKVIEIPVQVYGEVSGTVYESGVDSTGLGRIRVNIYRNGGELVKSTLTESDGYFDFLGLPPGNYTASLDPLQLERINRKAVHASRSFKIKPSLDGDVVKDISFKLAR